MLKEKIGFTQGVIWAVAECFRNGLEGAAEFLWKESNFGKEDLKYGDSYDTDKLKDKIRELNDNYCEKCHAPLFPKENKFCELCNFN